MKINFKISSCLNWAITILWFFFIVWLWCYSGVDRPKELNGIGDFLAGVFAPLAFFWLVRGFYQQGKGIEQNSIALRLQADELKASTEALNLQVQEMKASVDQQKEISKFYKLELEERNYKARAKFEISGLFVQDKKVVEGFALNVGQAPYHRNCSLNFHLNNLGAIVHKVTVRITNGAESEVYRFPGWDYKETFSFEYQLNDNEYNLLLVDYVLFKVFVSYTTENGIRIDQYTTIDVSPSMKINEVQNFTTMHGLFEDINI